MFSIRFFSALLFMMMIFSQALPAMGLADLNNPLPCSLTAAESEMISGDYRGYLQNLRMELSGGRGFRKPVGPIRFPGEFEPAEGICFSWAGYTDLLKALISEASQEMKVFLAVSSFYQGSASRTLEAAGARMENLVFVDSSLDSVWMRDFGPYFIYGDSGNREIIDCLYNRPRPNDDKFPSILGKVLGVKSHLCSLIMPGGNFMTDGHGLGIMTDVVFDPSQGGDPDMSLDQLKQYMREYFGITKVIILKDLARDGTGHVDIFAKLLDDTNIIVGKYARPQDGFAGNYEILEENARILANETNGRGEKFRITRIPMPAYKSYVTYTHTNSTILNDKVFVPIYNRGTDEEALAVYRKVLPGHKVIGFDCNDVITANGAIHCITKLVMAAPLKISAPILPFEIDRGRTAYVRVRVQTAAGSDEAVRVKLHWSANPEGPFISEEATRTAEGRYLVTLPDPDQGSEVWYFISAEIPGRACVTLPENGVDEPVHLISR